MSSKNNNNSILHLLKNTNSIQNLLKNKGSEIFTNAKGVVQNAPSSYKIVLAIIMFFFVIYYTYFTFKFTVSIFFAFITFIVLLTIHPVASIAFAFIYIYCFYQLIMKREQTFGKIIKDTDIIKNKGPLISSKTAVIVNQADIPKSETTNAFSYQFWIYINGSNNFPDNKNYENTWTNYRYGQWKNVFYRGDPMKVEDGSVNKMLQFPGVWLAPKLNNLSVVFNNGADSGMMERLEIENIPMNEWLCLTILVEGYSVGVYINGKLENTILINQVYPENIQEKNIFIGVDNLLNDCVKDCPTGTNGGFPGFIGEMIYYPYVLSLSDIQQSYSFYKRIVDTYQKKVIDSKKIIVPKLIHNKDKNNDVTDIDNLPATMDNMNTSIFNY